MSYGGYSGYGAPQGGYGQGPPPGGPGYGPPGIDPTIHQWFLAVDTDRTGKISALELQQALTNSNWSHFNAETCRLMIGMFDRDFSGQIDLNEFQALWSYIQQWKGVFDQYDRDRSGAIEAQELATGECPTQWTDHCHWQRRRSCRIQAFNQMGYRLSPQFSQLVVMKFDLHGQRSLTLDNFIQSCVLLKSITDTFRQKDAAGQGNIRLSYEEFMMMVMLNKP